MSWDIYGERLERGHCEVHPWVGEEYPCSICCMEDDKRRHDKQLEKEYYEQLEKEYYEELEQEHLETLENIDGAGI